VTLPSFPLSSISRLPGWEHFLTIACHHLGFPNLIVWICDSDLANDLSYQTSWVHPAMPLAFRLVTALTTCRKQQICRYEDSAGRGIKGWAVDGTPTGGGDMELVAGRNESDTMKACAQDAKDRRQRLVCKAKGCMIEAL
jgi:hypothetical protein